MAGKCIGSLSPIVPGWLMDPGDRALMDMNRAGFCGSHGASSALCLIRVSLPQAFTASIYETGVKNKHNVEWM